MKISYDMAHDFAYGCHDIIKAHFCYKHLLVTHIDPKITNGWKAGSVEALRSIKRGRLGRWRFTNPETVLAVCLED